MDEKDLIGSYSADFRLQDEVARLVFSRKLDARRLITHQFPLDQTAAAVELASHPTAESLKVVVTQDEGRAGDFPTLIGSNAETPSSKSDTWPEGQAVDLRSGGSPEEGQPMLLQHGVTFDESLGVGPLRDQIIIVDLSSRMRSDIHYDRSTVGLNPRHICRPLSRPEGTQSQQSNRACQQ